MKYFATLPKLITTDARGNSKLFTNIIARSSIIPSLFTNPLTFYPYDIQESDTPEIIAHKYYNDVDRFWLVMFANQMLDPQWDWPMNYSIFNEYLNLKYEPGQLTDPHHYQKITTKTDSISGTVTIEKINVDLDTYNDLIETTNTYTLPSGAKVSVVITKTIVDNYTYELNLNESKRNIKILNKIYAEQIEKEFERLMSL
jgi:hypothetical protein